MFFEEYEELRYDFDDFMEMMSDVENELMIANTQTVKQRRYLMTHLMNFFVTRYFWIVLRNVRSFKSVDETVYFERLI